MRGPARAVRSETRDLGIKWPQWHTQVFDEKAAVDMREVCPQDVVKQVVDTTVQCGETSGDRTSDNVNVHVDARWEALGLTAQPPKKFRNVSDVKVSARDGFLSRGMTTQVQSTLMEQ